MGIDQIRQAWLTFAPRLPDGGVYKDTEWTIFSDWSISDPNNIRTLQIAGPGSVRIGNGDDSAVYSGSGWKVQSANNYWRGFARVTAEARDSVTIAYECDQTHDLYLGTSLYQDRGTISISLDGDPATTLNCFLNISSEVVTRRILRKSVPGGTHAVTLMLQNSQPFVFDYVEAAVTAENIGDAVVTYDEVSPSLDFDTDATYKMSPQRLLWHLQKLGFRGQLNEYLGVFWWNQRKRAGGAWNSAVVAFGGVWAEGDIAQLSIGSFTMTKTIIVWDTVDTIARHFVAYINAASVSMWAESTGNGELTIHTRTPNWGDTLSVSSTSSNGTITTSGTLARGSDGVWQIDSSAANPINFPVRQWHGGLFKEVKAAGLQITASFSMELVNPPDDGTVANAWQARFYDGTAVTTDTGFANLKSSQCSFIENVTEFHKAVFTTMAGLQNVAGLTPWLQFGEFVWWFYSSMAQPVGFCAFTDPIAIGVAQPHRMETGDRVAISGVLGCTSANGTWPVTVTDSTHFTIPVAANGQWVTGSGQVRGGSMAYYDPITSAAAQSALGRPLNRFTCQDDDPTVNGGADATFLAARLKAHVDAIRAAVLAQYPNAKFEILYPNDVNNPPGTTGRVRGRASLPWPAVEACPSLTSGPTITLP